MVGLLSVYLQGQPTSVRLLPIRPILLHIVGFRGFDSSIILTLRGGVPRPIGDSLESLTQAMLVGVMLVGGLGVAHSRRVHRDAEAFLL